MKIKKKKVCKAGWSCGSSCISKKKNCKITVKENSKELLNAIAGPAIDERLAELMSKKSWTQEEEAEFKVTYLQAPKSIRGKVIKKLSEDKKEVLPDLMLGEPPAGKPLGSNFKAPLVENEAREKYRKALISKFFGNDSGKVEKLESDIKDFLASRKVKMVVDSDVVKLLKKGDGLLKNLHQTGSSGGLNDVVMRLDVENYYMGYSKDELPKNMPKYGFVSTNSVFNVNFYGDSVFEIEIPKDQYTVTFGDSLQGAYTSKPDNPKIESFADEKLLPDFIEDWQSYGIERAFKNTYSEYIEAQVAGDLSFSQFKEIEMKDEALFKDPKLGKPAPNRNTPASKKEQNSKPKKNNRLDQSTKDAIKSVMTEHNKASKYKISYKQSKEVYDRGVAAYYSSHSPQVSSSSEWGIRRLKTLTAAIRKGEFKSGKFDLDIMREVMGNDTPAKFKKKD